MQEKDSLIFISENTISSFRSNDSIRQDGGIGLENIKKRLELLYEDKHQLIIDSNQKTFKVTLIIPT
ncbi:MAG: hypothetical protein IPH69_13490 [Bacteroidales bacterium]|nr:hypothetical protein [Bacteroidales bacterium]